MITGVISSNLVDKPCPNDRVHTRMFVLINSYSLDNVLLGNQSEIPKTKKHLSALSGPPLNNKLSMHRFTLLSARKMEH